MALQDSHIESNNVDTNARDNKVLPSVRPPPSGVISHVNTTQECSWYVTMIVPRPILCFPQVRVRTYLTIHVKNEKMKEESIYTYFHLLFLFLFLFQASDSTKV